MTKHLTLPETSLEIGILSVLLNCHCRHKIYNIHDCLLMGWFGVAVTR